ncbi:MAG: RNA-binding cell elongation regulator Jag/EloR [Gaiella sp.]
MNDELSVEATGETVGKAKWAAIRELERLAPGLDREAVRFQVVTEGERGLLGVGTTPARVVASAAAPPPRETPAVEPAGTTEAEIATGLLDRVARVLDLPVTVEIDERTDEIVATAVGGEAGVLIGRHGQMLDALQVLANAVAHSTLGPDRRRIVVDAAGYRARREEALETLARRTAERVAATGQSVSLDPMSAAERRIVHESLKDDPEVETTSEGAEPHRAVVVLPRHTPV